MKSIWKFRVPLSGTPTINMPIGAEILSFQTQDDQLCIWAIVDTEKDVEPREFLIVGTGHSFDESNAKYIGTTQQENGRFVWHLFEVQP